MGVAWVLDIVECGEGKGEFDFPSKASGVEGNSHHLTWEDAGGNWILRTCGLDILNNEIDTEGNNHCNENGKDECCGWK